MAPIPPRRESPQRWRWLSALKEVAPDRNALLFSALEEPEAELFQDAPAAAQQALSRIAGALTQLDTSSAWFARRSVTAVTSLVGAVAEHTRTVAREIVDEFTDTTDAASSAPSSPSPGPVTDDGTAGLPETLLEFVEGLVTHPETFTLFPPSDAPFRVTDEMELHATAVLRASPALSQLRYELCPRHIPDHRFWEVYFTLIANRGLASSCPLNAAALQHEPSPEPAPVAEMWQCTFCTYKNAPEAPECDMCGGQRGHEPLYLRGLSSSPRTRPVPDDLNDSYF